MDGRRVNHSAISWIVEADGPLIPHLRVGVITPYCDDYLLSLICNDRVLDGEIHGEPRVHAGCVLRGVRAVKDFLVEFRCEVPTEAMNFTLLLLHCKGNAIIFFHAGLLTLTVTLDLLHYLVIVLLGIGQVPESEDRLGLVTAGICGGENAHDVG